jgi:hypothetical protein
MWKDIKVLESSEGNVTKFIFEGEKIIAESVLYKYGSYEKFKKLVNEQKIYPEFYDQNFFIPGVINKKYIKVID